MKFTFKVDSNNKVTVANNAEELKKYIFDYDYVHELISNEGADYAFDEIADNDKILYVVFDSSIKRMILVELGDNLHCYIAGVGGIVNIENNDCAFTTNVEAFHAIKNFVMGFSEEDTDNYEGEDIPDDEY